jgi:hypothetical protein
MLTHVSVLLALPVLLPLSAATAELLEQVLSRLYQGSVKAVFRLC